MKRKQVDNDADEARKRERQAAVVAKVQDLDDVGTRRYLDDIATRWQIDAASQSFQDVITRAFDNFGMDVASDLDLEDMGSYGLRLLDERIHDHEVEMIALYHKLREHGLFDDEQIRLRAMKCIEQIYYAKRAVLSSFQGKLSIHQMHCEMELDADLDARLGSWSLRFRWINDDTNPVQKLLLHMLDCAMEKRYRRQGNWCFEPIIIDGHNTHAWRPVMEIKQWLYEETRKETNWEQWQWLTASANNAKTVVEYLTNCSDYSFPELRKDRSTFAFTNGVYRAREDKFYPLGGEDTLAESIAACKFFPYEFLEYGPDQDIPTPHLESIMDYQGYSEEVKQWMLIALGRLLYELNDLDGWQVYIYKQRNFTL